MAGAISFVAGATAEVQAPPVGPFAKRSGMQHAENRRVQDTSIRGPSGEGLGVESARNGKGPVSTAAQGQGSGSSHKTMLIFERDEKNGKMYLYIRDRRTGEEVTRIPRKLLGDAEPQPTPSHRLDIRV